MVNKPYPSQNETEAAFAARMLDSLPAVEVPLGLEGRILADFDSLAARKTASRPKDWLGALAMLIRPGMPAWQPAAALALSLLCGIAIGAMVPAAEPQAPATAASANAQVTETVPAFDMLSDLL